MHECARPGLEPPRRQEREGFLFLLPFAAFAPSRFRFWNRQDAKDAKVFYFFFLPLRPLRLRGSDFGTAKTRRTRRFFTFSSFLCALCAFAVQILEPPKGAVHETDANTRMHEYARSQGRKERLESPPPSAALARRFSSLMVNRGSVRFLQSRTPAKIPCRKAASAEGRLIDFTRPRTFGKGRGIMHLPRQSVKADALRRNRGNARCPGVNVAKQLVAWSGHRHRLGRPAVHKGRNAPILSRCSAGKPGSHAPFVERWARPPPGGSRKHPY